MEVVTLPSGDVRFVDVYKDGSRVEIEEELARFEDEWNMEKQGLPDRRPRPGENLLSWGLWGLLIWLAYGFFLDWRARRPKPFDVQIAELSRIADQRAREQEDMDRKERDGHV